MLLPAGNACGGQRLGLWLVQSVSRFSSPNLASRFSLRLEVAPLFAGGEIRRTGFAFLASWWGINCSCD